MYKTDHFYKNYIFEFCAVEVPFPSRPFDPNEPIEISSGSDSDDRHDGHIVLVGVKKIRTMVLIFFSMDLDLNFLSRSGAQFSPLPFPELYFFRLP